jgi:hypothetical protein
MQVLDNKMTKIVLVVAVAAVLAFLVKSNEKTLKLNNDMSMLVMGLIVVVALYAIFLINNEQDELESFQANEEETLTESEVSTTVDPSEMNNSDMNTAETEVNNAENTAVANNNAEQPANNAPEDPSVQPAEPLGDNEEPKGVQDMYNTSNAVPDQCYPKDVLSSADLLPKDTDSTWAQSVPATNGALSDQNFLNAGYHIGVNTVGQSLRNANRQLRSDPPCPRSQVSPWMQSTIESDTNRRPLEMGSV